MDATLQKIVARLEDITARLERVEGRAGGAPAASSSSTPAAAPAAAAPAAASKPFVAAFDALVNGDVAGWVAKGKSLGGDASAAADLVAKAFAELRKVIVLAAQCSEPAQAELGKIVGSVGKVLEAAQDLKSKSKRTDWENHCATVAEGLGAMSWVVMKPAPAPFVKEQIDASMFYSNKVRVAHKGDAAHVGFVDGFRDVLQAMQAYVKEHHTTGLAWNTSGPKATEAALAGGAAGGATGGKAPPPPPAGGPPAPPPPPAGGPPAAAGGGGGGGGGMAALFGELNKGSAITSGLKKVTRDMTNKDKQVSGAVTDVPKKAAPAAKPAAAGKRQVPEKLELDGTKWKVEGFKDRKDLDIVVENPKQVLYCYGLVNCVVTVKGKCNHITMDGCTKTGVLFDDVVAAVELVRCKSAQVQSNGTVPSMAIENSDGVHIYWLDPRNNDCEVITSCSSEVNITLKYDGDEEFSEVAIPQQFLTKVKGKALATDPISHLG